MSATLAEGIHDMAADQYHADPCEQPSLSSSIARLMLTHSPAHARAAQPRLNPDYVREEDEKFDVGTVAHALLLQGIEAVRVVDAPDWRTKAAKEERDEARALGITPLLAKQWDGVQQMVAAVRDQLASFDCDPPLLTDGEPEKTLIWREENGVWCRARLDWLHTSGYAADDLKTTTRSANPEQWARSLFNTGYDVQACFYLRGIQQTTGKHADFRFVVCETAPPYAVSVVSLAPDAVELARAKVKWAINEWARCLESGVWPSYPTRVAFAEAPAWELARWLEREEREAA